MNIKHFKAILVFFMSVGLVACQKEQPTITFQDNIVFEYMEQVDNNEIFVSKIINSEQSKYDMIKNVEVVTNQVGLGYQGKLVALFNNQERVFEFNYEVKDTKFPVLSGVETMTVEQGQHPNFDKIVAHDEIDGKLEVTIEGNFDINIVGNYDLYAIAVDKNNNQTKEPFVLIVAPKKVTNNQKKNNTSKNDSKKKSDASQNLEEKKGTTPQEKKYIVSNPESILVLVNKKRYLPTDYTPPLTRFPEGYAVNSQQKARPEVVAAYIKMQDQLKVETGLSMYVTSSYRTFDYQQKLFDRYVKQDGVKAAERYSARPGTSEHHTGLALDLETVSGNMTKFGETPQGQWVAENCYKFGFIIRYKKEWEPITGYMAEPWHIRYLGIEEATRVHHANQPYELLYQGN